MTSHSPQPALANHTSQNYNEHASFVYSNKNTAPILQLLDAQRGENIADLGCGTGQLTEKIKTLVGEGEVWGVDSSEDMVSELHVNRTDVPAFIRQEERRWLGHRVCPWRHSRLHHLGSFSEG